MNGNGRNAARQRAVRIGEGLHVGELLADRERLEVGRGVPLVAGNAAVEDAGSRADRSFAVTERIPCQAEARREMRSSGVETMPRPTPGSPDHQQTGGDRASRSAPSTARPA